MTDAPPSSPDRDPRDPEIELPVEMTPAEVVAAGRQWLAEARRQVMAANLAGSGRALCHRLSRLHDQLIRALHRRQLRLWEVQGRGAPGSHAVVALGGYGRRELCLHSDVDLLFVVGDKKGAQEAFVKELLHALFDFRLEVGFSVRRVEECLQTINADYQSVTAMIESRFLAGSRPLFQHYLEVLMRALRGAGRRWYLQAKLQEWRERRRRFDDSVYLREPNLKESPGGLRDLHAVRWLLLALRGTGEFNRLEEEGALTGAELKRLRQAEDFILQLRNELHALAGRKNDTLTFEAQVEIARRKGSPATETSLAEEALMREYYQHARDVAHLAGRAFNVLLRGEKSTLGALLGTFRRRRIDANLLAQDGAIFIDPRRPDHLSEDPRRLLALFGRARRLGLRVSERTREAIERLIPTLPEEFPADPVNRETFMDLLRGPRHVAVTLADMHDCGLLAAYLPEFERVRCMARMDYYHRYTVDEHLIRAVGMFERLLTEPAKARTHAGEIARQIERRDLLNLSLLLHDVGKGYGKGHALIGGQLIQRIGTRMGLEHDDIETLRFLVLSHLKISHVAQRRDAEDPQVAAQLADEVGSLERLKLLYVHSVCDLMAVSPEAMTEWKRLLYETCYHAAAKALAGVPGDAEPAALGVPLVTTRLRELARARLQGGGAAPGEIEKRLARLESFLENVPPRYLHSTPLEFIAEHFALIQELDETRPVAWSLHPGLGLSELIVSSVDLPGTFAKTCGALASKEINIVSAQIFSTLDGYAVNRFQVTDLRGQPLPAGFRLERLRDDLSLVFLGKKTIEELIASSSVNLARRRATTFRRPPEAWFDNDASQECTVLEVRAADRPGLLFQIATVLDAERLNLQRAMVMTEAYGVMDAFYVTDYEYNKIHDEARMERIKARLLAVLDEAPRSFPSEPDAPSGGSLASAGVER